MPIAINVSTQAQKTGLIDFSHLSRDEQDAELQAGWDDLQAGRIISLEQSIENYNRRHAH